MQLDGEHGGLNGSAVYLATEDAFPNKRLASLVSPFQVKHPEKTEKQLTDHIYVEHASNIESLWNTITKRLPLILESKNIRLLVIDSLAALFRVEFGLDEGGIRGQTLMAVGAYLKELSDTYHIPVVCVNQVRRLFPGSQIQLP